MNKQKKTDALILILAGEIVQAIHDLIDLRRPFRQRALWRDRVKQSLIVKLDEEKIIIFGVFVS